MVNGGRPSKLTHRATPTARLVADAAPVQLPLLFFPPADAKANANGATNGTHGKDTARLPRLEKLTTGEVARLIGVDRSTLYRWHKKRIFPPKHKSGKWLRADVEKWMTEHESESQS
jgi:predicted DNA-binding transcriptional regulator AlpA